MENLKKCKKVDLIKLVLEYEKDISWLVERINIIESAKEIIIKEYIIVDDDNNKTIQYLQKRINVVNDRHKKDIYMRELERLTPVKTN